MSLDPDYLNRRESRNMSICSDDSLDKKHRNVHVIVGIKVRELAVLAIEHPLLLKISGDWTPRQVWNEYCAHVNMDEAIRATSPLIVLYLSRHDRGFDDPTVIPFMDKPIYDWENWNAQDAGMTDGARLVFCLPR